MGDSGESAAHFPGIVAPVSRYLGVVDLDRSLAFYRDVLGFSVHPLPEGDGVIAVAEAVYGPARVQFGVEESACDSTGQRRPRGSAILFFQTDDVAAMRDAVSARGGQPSELEKVNWIKMRVFEIHDPDGHRLWFAQSFQQPSPARDPHRQLRRALPEMPLNNVPAGISYYRDVLGFKINHAQHDLGVMDRDDITIVLIARTEQHSGIGSCYVYVRDANALHAELLARGANVQGEPVSHPWGLRDFAVLDPEGNQIRFGQTFE
jgi:catechol 2,3-dioxygenase-like lactoylglutathione lyase family enzyme